MATNPISPVSLGEEAHRGEGQVKTHGKRGAETGVMLPPAKGYLGLPEAGRERKGSSPGVFRERNQEPSQHLDFKL